jgi:hypothetical protein
MEGMSVLVCVALSEFTYVPSQISSLSLFHCNSNLPAIVKGNVCDTVQYTEKITLVISKSSLPSVSITVQAPCENVYRQLPTPLIQKQSKVTVPTVDYKHIQKGHNKKKK